MAKILIIEDDPAQIQLTSMMPIQDGRKVLRAVDAESGMALARTALPELIVMDVLLPSMNASIDG
jgi:two-component system cell cycle response regulator DivK